MKVAIVLLGLASAVHVCHGEPRSNYDAAKKIGTLVKGRKSDDAIREVLPLYHGLLNEGDLLGMCKMACNRNPLAETACIGCVWLAKIKFNNLNLADVIPANEWGRRLERLVIVEEVGGSPQDASASGTKPVEPTLGSPKSASSSGKDPLDLTLGSGK